MRNVGTQPRREGSVRVWGVPGGREPAAAAAAAAAAVLRGLSGGPGESSRALGQPVGPSCQIQIRESPGAPHTLRRVDG